MNTNITKEDILTGLLLEATDRSESNQAARVNAWGKIAKIMGFEIQKIESTNKQQVIFVGEELSLKDWISKQKN